MNDAKKRIQAQINYWKMWQQQLSATVIEKEKTK